MLSAFFVWVNMGKEKKPDGPEEKTLYRKIIDGEAEPQGEQKGWKNLEKRVSFNQMDPEKLRAISKKGGEAVQKIYGEKKTAREALENHFRSHPNDVSPDYREAAIKKQMDYLI